MNDDMNKKLFKCPEGQEALAESFYDEIFHDGEYDRYGARVEPNNIVVDFGAYVGMFSQFAVSKGAKQVYCVEANPIHYECLVENTKHTPNIKPHLGTVSDRRNETGEYNLERIMDENNIQNVDYVKVDIEHWEYPLLINMSDELMSGVSKWAIEFHFKWSDEGTKWGTPMFDGHKTSKLLYIMDKFTRNGFKLAYEHIHKKYNIAMLYAWK
jgi:hypothetical protein